MWLTWWPHAYAGVPPTQVPSTRLTSAQLLSAARHPSATPERLRSLVDGLSWWTLDECWTASSQALGVARTDSARLALVWLREAILDEMESSHPRAFTRWRSD